MTDELKANLKQPMKELKASLKSIMKELKPYLIPVCVGICMVCCLYNTWRLSQQVTKKDIRSIVKMEIRMEELNRMIEESK
jgi:hypothetical protein